MPERSARKPVILLDFTRGKVSHISYAQMERMMREQEARGVKFTSGRPR